jgi:hypothetical protein
MVVGVEAAVAAAIMMIAIMFLLLDLWTVKTDEQTKG